MTEKNKPRVLVAVVDYPNNNGRISMMYVHSRNKYYNENQIDVTVLSFSEHDEYFIDGIRVISLKKYEKENQQYDILISHAANLRNHYLFLKKYGSRFPRYIFFFHGHEVLRINEVYSKPFPFAKKSKSKIIYQNIYDSIKLSIWRRFYLANKEKSQYVFVSKWMLEQFLKWTGIPYEEIADSTSITYNCIGHEFEDYCYDPYSEKKYDFITVRGNIDGSKYAVDVVNELAKCNPHLRFLLIGKGKLFNYYSKADNLAWMDRTMTHEEIIAYLDKTRCALMPTRTDAQGLMMCEMASTGIPLITSDIPVCHEVFENFDNVEYIENDNGQTDLGAILQRFQNRRFSRHTKYFNANTSEQEVKIILASMGY